MGSVNVCQAAYPATGTRLPSVSSFVQREGFSLLLIGLLAAHLSFLAWPDLVPPSFFEAPFADSPEPADAIVFLGGDAGSREQKSLGLLEQGKGQFLLVTGENDFTTRRIKDLLPADKRVVEPAATSTWENASFSYPLLHSRGVKSAILVTDWWHTRRALACFRRACPGIQLSVVPASLPNLKNSLNFSSTTRRREYMARLWYAVRYGVW